MPPDRGPAAAHAGNFRGFSGVRWPSDFQVRSGHCDRERITQSPRRGDAIASLGEAPVTEPHRGACWSVRALSDLLPTQSRRRSG